MNETDEQFLMRLKTTPGTFDQLPSQADVRRFWEIEKRERLARIYRAVTK